MPHQLNLLAGLYGKIIPEGPDKKDTTMQKLSPKSEKKNIDLNKYLIRDHSQELSRQTNLAHHGDCCKQCKKEERE